MKKAIMFAAIFTFFAAMANGQTAKRMPDGNYVATSKAKAQPKSTGKYFRDKDGTQYPVWQNSTGKLFIIKKSRKTGKEYRSYLKLEN